MNNGWSFCFLRPLTEEEIADLKERHYDSIAEKQRVVDLKLQSEVSGHRESTNGFSSRNVRISHGHRDSTHTEQLGVVQQLVFFSLQGAQIPSF